RPPSPSRLALAPGQNASERRQSHFQTCGGTRDVGPRYLPVNPTSAVGAAANTDVLVPNPAFHGGRERNSALRVLRPGVMVRSAAPVAGVVLAARAFASRLPLFDVARHVEEPVEAPHAPRKRSHVERVPVGRRPAGVADRGVEVRTVRPSARATV